MAAFQDVYSSELWLCFGLSCESYMSSSLYLFCLTVVLIVSEMQSVREVGYILGGGKERGRKGCEVGFFSICLVVVGEGGVVSGLLLCESYFAIRSKIGLYTGWHTK
jgi:hypothetical protein